MTCLGDLLHRMRVPEVEVGVVIIIEAPLTRHREEEEIFLTEEEGHFLQELVTIVEEWAILRVPAVTGPMGGALFSHPAHRAVLWRSISGRVDQE
jgi:hypothetical protein